MAKRVLSTQLLTGAIIVPVGFRLVLSTTGVADAGRLWRYVPSLFVLLGVWGLYRSGLRNVTAPAILVVEAGTVQLLALDLITGETVAAWWPVVIIASGLSLLVANWRRQRRIPTVSGNDFDLVGVFGGSNLRLTSTAFVGGTATAAFGGVEVDLREVEVADPPAVVSAPALFGGVEPHVPDDWTVALDGLPIFGAAEDERPRYTDVEAKDTPDRLVTGFEAFGGLTVTDRFGAASGWRASPVGSFARKGLTH